MLLTNLQTFDHHRNYHLAGMRAAWCVYCVRLRLAEAAEVAEIFALLKGKKVPPTGA